MKKVIAIIGVLLLFLVACSSDSEDANENDDTSKKETESEEENKPLKKEILYSHDHEDSGDYSFQSIRTDASGKVITFTGLEDIDRKKEYFTFVVNQQDEVFEALELAEDENQDRRCTDLLVSPSGEYLVYNCHDDGIDFSIYDMNKEETIHQMEESDSYIMNIHAISDDKIVIYEVETDDYETELVFYDAETDEKTSIVLEDLFDMEDVSFDTLIQTDDGQHLLINALTSLYMIDVENESAEEIVNVDAYAEEYDAEIFIYNIEYSPDGKYSYYNISENDSDPVYSEFFFHNLDTDEVTGYSELDYSSIRGFDVNGNMLLKDDDLLYVYNAKEDVTRIIPDIEATTYMRYLTLSHDGKYIIYTDKESSDDDTYIQQLIRIELGDISSYETTELKAQQEKRESEIKEDEIVLTEETFDEKEQINELWENSVDVMFPTKFPGEVEGISNHYVGQEDQRRYLQTIRLKTDSIRDDNINFRAVIRENPDKCPGFADLDVVDTIDGNDFYFYDYKNRDVEAGIAIDDVCYYFDTEDHTEEEMKEMAASLEEIDKPVQTISFDDVLFPTKFPSEKPQATNPRVIVHSNGDKIDFLM